MEFIPWHLYLSSKTLTGDKCWGYSWYLFFRLNSCTSSVQGLFPQVRTGGEKEDVDVEQVVKQMNKRVWAKWRERLWITFTLRVCFADETIEAQMVELVKKGVGNSSAESQGHRSQQMIKLYWIKNWQVVLFETRLKVFSTSEFYCLFGVAASIKTFLWRTYLGYTWRENQI